MSRPAGEVGATRSRFDAVAEAVGDVFQGAALYYLSSVVVLLGAVFGSEVVVPPTQGGDYFADLMSACVRFDGHHYREIADTGYRYDPADRSIVAFFPAYPLTVVVARRATGCDLDFGLLAVSNAWLLGSFVVLARYLRHHPLLRDADRGWVALAFAVWPTTFFLRMAYAESLFVFCTLVTLYGIVRKWPLLPLAVVAGFASATRPVGLAVTAAYAWHVLGQPGPWRVRVLRLAVLAPMAGWGLLAYMLYQAVAFGDPLAFARTQVHWTSRAPVERPTPSEKLEALATLEPARGVYDPRSGRYWAQSADANNLLFSLDFWNPALFAVAAGLVAFGAARRWLTGPEVVLGVALLAIPYVTRSYEMSMGSHGRFAAVVIPTYLVVGRGLAKLPPPLGSALVAVSAVVLAFWSALYAAGRTFY